MNVSTIESFNITSGFLVYEKVKEKIIEHLGFTISKNNYNHYTQSQLVASRTSMKPTGVFSNNFLYILFTNGVNYSGSSGSSYQDITAITIEPRLSNSYETSSSNIFDIYNNNQLNISNLDNKLYVIKNENSIIFINRAGDLYSILKITITDDLLLVNSNYGYRGGNPSTGYSLSKMKICPSYKETSSERSAYYYSSLFKSIDGTIIETLKPQSTLALHNQINRFSNEYNKITSFISPTFCFNLTTTTQKGYFVQPLDGNTTSYQVLALEDKDYGIIDMQLMKPEEEFTIGSKTYKVFPSGEFSFINQNVGIVLRIA